MSPFWSPFGSLWVPFWLPLAAFGYLLDPFWLPFGALGLTFACLRTQFSYFWNLHAYFQIFLHTFYENPDENQIFVKFVIEDLNFLTFYVTGLRIYAFPNIF